MNRQSSPQARVSDRHDNEPRAALLEARHRICAFRESCSSASRRCSRLAYLAPRSVSRRSLAATSALKRLDRREGPRLLHRDDSDVRSKLLSGLKLLQYNSTVIGGVRSQLQLPRPPIFKVGYPVGKATLGFEYKLQRLR